MTMNRFSTFVFVVATALILVFLIAPLLVVVSLSFSQNLLATFPPKGFTFDWYAQVIAQEDFQRSFKTSALLAVASTFMSLMLATPAALALNRGILPGAAIVETVLLSPMILPILIAGLALTQFTSSIGLHSTMGNLFIGHTLITLPYVLRTVTASLKQLDHSLEEAASTLGASSMTIFWLITIPQIMPGLVAGCIFSFMISFDDFSLSFWLSNTETEPLPVFLHNKMASVFDPSIATMSSLMIAVGVIVVLLIERIVGLRKAMGV